MIRAPIGEYQTSNQSGPDRPPMRGLVVQSEPERVHCRWDLFWLDTVYTVSSKQGYFLKEPLWSSWSPDIRLLIDILYNC